MVTFDNFLSKRIKFKWVFYPLLFLESFLSANKKIHPYDKYGKCDENPLANELLKLMRENRIEFHKTSMRFDAFFNSQYMELIEIFIYLKRYIRDNKDNDIKSTLFINKHGLRIEPID